VLPADQQVHDGILAGVRRPDVHAQRAPYVEHHTVQIEQHTASAMDRASDMRTHPRHHRPPRRPSPFRRLCAPRLRTRRRRHYPISTVSSASSTRATSRCQARRRSSPGSTHQIQGQQGCNWAAVMSGWRSRRPRSRSGRSGRSPGAAGALTVPLDTLECFGSWGVDDGCDRALSPRLSPAARPHGWSTWPNMLPLGFSTASRFPECFRKSLTMRPTGIDTRSIEAYMSTDQRHQGIKEVPWAAA
jgi:hypothetical protein